MDISCLNDITTVSLSRRNIEGLLEQLNDGARDAQITRRTDAGLLIVHAQEDGAHYNGAGRDGIAGASAPSQTYGERVDSV